MIHITITGPDTVATQKTLEDLRAAMDGSIKDLCNVKGLESVNIYPNMETNVPTAAVAPNREAPTQDEEPQPKVEPDSNEESEQEQPVKTYSLVEVRAQANAYRDKYGIEKLREIFRKHGGEKLKDIPESSYTALMDDLRNLMKEDA